MPAFPLAKRDVPGPEEPQMLDRTPRRYLKQSDRCDQCGAAAWAAATFVGVHDDGRIFTDATLYFCAHHFTQYEDQLQDTAERILDERPFLYAEVAGQKDWSEPVGESSNRKRRPGFNTGS